MAETGVNSNKYPKSIYYIIANEGAERFSFYGMRSILATFLVAHFFNPSLNPALQSVAEAKANEATHFFVSLAYALPFLGGLMADWFFGKYKVIFYISLVYCAGHLCLALFEDKLEVFQYGLLLIAIGAGGIKSCVTANLGDQFTAANRHLLSKVYSWFYFSINAGSVLSTVMIPLIYANYGPKWAFGIPGILMALAALIFFLGRKNYVNVPPSGVNKNNFVFISVYALFNFKRKKKGSHLLDVAKEKFDAVKVEDVKTVYNVLAVFSFIPIFWALWDQNLSEWVLQATKLDLNVLGFKFLPEQIQTANALFLLLFIPLFNYLLYPFLDKRGIKTTPLRRIGAGLVLTALAFVVIALLQVEVDAGGHPSALWQLLAYAILAAAEVLVSITGLEYAYTQASKSMKSTLVAIWLLTTALGNLFTALVNKSISNGGFFAQFKGANYYWFFIGLLCFFILVYMLVSPHISERKDSADIQLLPEDSIPVYDLIE
ncbi:POT-type proton-dependent oligopeptide transporter [Mucilaginibacter paludis]|uniref:TGF-beta receptor type I/II extracellular region n=1 Tax=Mucilaginibacter paludis DSM 18603 TaxID=714943 RepID=H1YBA5_9SPHI|nr:MFS transporter [Mucilaginibacter paludis]EHQ30631.1 TGF-beta receptor type I/II extracellular region [Mucilaginibacter paludis DSM 18603]